MSTSGAGLTLRPLEGAAEFAACVSLQEHTWGPGFAERVPESILRIAQETGGIASGAFDADGRLIGFVFGITGWVDGAPIHWSDMLAVVPDERNRGIGIELKLHQRNVLLERGVTTVAWTFDPLEARNAHLNLSRLGAVAQEYRRDAYTGSDSPLHAGIGTDRLVARWLLDSPRVAGRTSGSTAPPSHADIESVPLLNPSLPGDLPACAAPVTLPDVPAIRIAVPADIQMLRDRDVRLAQRWRANTRASFEAAFEAGFVARELVRAGAVGWYLLERRGA